MKVIWLIAVVCCISLAVEGADDALPVDEVVQSAQDWAKENLDADTLAALGQANQVAVKQLLQDLQARLQGQYVIDLAALRDTASNAVPLLEKYEETAPYASWLKAQLDYMDVAGQFRQKQPSPPATAPGPPPPALTNPPPQQERDLWMQRLKERPWPEAAKTYVPALKKVFTAKAVPPELVWIAEIESSFDPGARSPSGAAGLFQLTAATAKRFGLRTGFFDQRFKPELCAEAAAKYLGYLYRHFKDWRLALAAYNAGEGTVDRLLARSGKRTFDAIATRLPAETQMYVPRVEAVLMQREGIKLSELESKGLN